MQVLRRLLTGWIVLGSLSMATFAAATDTQSVQQTPLIMPQLLTVIDQKKCVEEAEHDYCVEMSIVLETTSVPWLDYALLARVDFSDKKEPQQQPSDLDNYLQQVQQRADYLVAEKYKEIKAVRESDDPYFAVFSHIESIRFIAQRNHLASFKQFSYDYAGGAHGMHEINYLLFDLNTQRQLLLPDLLQPFAHAKLFEALRESYQQNYADYAQSWLGESSSKQAEILLTDNFVFNEQGLTFSYPPYILGPYVEGDIRLSLNYNQLKDILKPEYIFDL